MTRQDMIDEILQAKLSGNGMNYSDYRYMLRDIFLHGTMGLHQMSDAMLEEMYSQWCGDDAEIKED